MFDSVLLSHVLGVGVWKHSVTELPQLEPPSASSNPTIRQFLLLAGGIALVLSRCPPERREAQLPRASRLYTLLRRELKRYGRTSASATLLLEAWHETSGLLDPVSNEAFRHCLAARQRYEGFRHEEEESSRQGVFASRALPLESTGAESEHARLRTR